MQLHYGNLIEQAKNGEFDVIIHGANSFHTMGAGIARHIKTNFPEAFDADKKTGYGDKNKLGTFSEATITRNENTFVVINAYTQLNYGGGVDNFEYDSFPSLLQSIKAKYGDKRIGVPLIGCGLAGGDEQRIVQMIKDNFEGVDYKLVEIDTNRILNYKENLSVEIKNKELEQDISFTKVSSPKEYTFFFHLTSPFSNFHPAKFEYKDLTFISNEQFMMYSKAKTFGDEATAQKIIEINSEPLAQKFINGELSREDITKDRDLSAQWQNLMMKAKKLGRGVQNYNEEIWNKRRSKVVLFGARLKFTQNLDLKQILINTGDTYMIEAAPRDSLSTMSPSIQNSKEEALMLPILQKLKEEFLAESKSQNKMKP